MADEKKTDSGLPNNSALPNIGKPATRALQNVGVHDLAAVTAWSESELAALHGVGPKALRILREALAAQGLRFRDDA